MGQYRINTTVEDMMNDATSALAKVNNSVEVLDKTEPGSA